MPVARLAKETLPGLRISELNEMSKRLDLAFCLADRQ